MSLEIKRIPIQDWMIFAFLAIALVLLAGVGNIWGASLFVFGAGTWLLISPPRKTPHPWLNWACIGLLCWTLIQLIPGLAPSVEWRMAIADAGLTSNSSRPAISPVEQLYAFLWIFIAISWLYIGVNFRQLFDRSERFRSLAAFVGAIAILSAACFLMQSAGHKYPLAADSHVFTFLPNRNHMALLAAMGGVAAFALGYDTMLRKPWQGLLFFSACAICLMAVLSLTSRAAILLFGFGLGVWLLASFQRSSFGERFKIVLPMGFLLLAVLFAVGQITTPRLIVAFGDPLAVREAEGRIAIYSDSWQMFSSVWMTGTGWNGFEPVFSHHRVESLSPMAIAHPESDWLWLWMESGVPGLIFVLAGIATLTSLVLWGSRRIERYRRIAAICLLMALLHGFVDVPLHNAAVFLFVVWLLGIALPEIEQNTLVRALFIPRFIWRGIGGGLVLFGAIMCYGTMTYRPWLPDTVESLSLKMLTSPDSVGSINDIDQWLDAASTRFPFIWPVHTNQARRSLAEGNVASARVAFSRARNARKDAGVVTFTEARIWAPLSTADALDAYRETFLERDMHDRIARFQAVVNNGRQNPALYAGLGRISRNDLQLRQIFLFAWNDAVVQRELRHELVHYPRLERWPTDQHAAMLWRVGETLGWRVLAEHLSKDHEWQARFIPLYAYALEVSTGWKSAGGLLVQHVTPAEFPHYGLGEPASRLELAYRRNPNDLASALAFLRTLVESNNWERVVEVCAHFQPPAGVNYPPSMHYWRARSLYELNRGSEAERYWRAYIRYLIQSGALPIIDA